MTNEPEGPWRDQRVHVLDAKCSTCIFRPGNLMHLSEGRKQDVVDGNVQNDSALTCHQTLPGWPPGTHKPAVCRGFYDVHKQDSFPLRLAQQMDVITFDPAPSKALDNTSPEEDA